MLHSSRVDTNGASDAIPDVATHVVLAIGLMTVALPGAASAASITATQSRVPFAAAYAGSANFTSASTVHFSGTGVASSLGASSNSGVIVITGSDTSCTGGLPNSNPETLTAANGDVLVITMHDVACPVSEGVLHGTGHWEVSGGTGRFRGATGQGTSDGGADFNHGKFAFTLVGTLVLANPEH